MHNHIAVAAAAVTTWFESLTTEIGPRRKIYAADRGYEQGIVARRTTKNRVLGERTSVDMTAYVSIGGKKTLRINRNDITYQTGNGVYVLGFYIYYIYIYRLVKC